MYSRRDRQSTATLFLPVQYLKVTENSCNANTQRISFALLGLTQLSTANDYDRITII